MDYRLLSIRQASIELAVSRDTLRKLIAQGMVPIHRLGGLTRINPPEVLRESRIAGNQGTAPTSACPPGLGLSIGSLPDIAEKQKGI